MMFLYVKRSMVTNKGIPKRDGSGQGRRTNKGRGGCKKPNQIDKEKPVRKTNEKCR